MDLGRIWVGFIGGASCVLDDKFILFGDANHLENRDVLVHFIERYGLELVDFMGFDIIDYGGIITL